MARKRYVEGFGIAVAYDDEDEEIRECNASLDVMSKAIRLILVVAGYAILALCERCIGGV